MLMVVCMMALGLMIKPRVTVYIPVLTAHNTEANGNQIHNMGWALKHGLMVNLTMENLLKA